MECLFRKRAKFFRKGAIFFEFDGAAYACVVAAALRDELGQSHHAVKTVVRWTDANERTVKNWFSATSGPSGQHLVALACHSDEVFGAFLVLSGRTLDPALAPNKLLELRDKLWETLQFIQRIFGERLEHVTQGRQAHEARDG